MRKQDQPSFRLRSNLMKYTYDHITTESEVFHSVGYIMHDGNIVVLTGENGCLAIDINNIPEFCNELMGLYEVYKDHNRIVKNQLEFLQGSGERGKKDELKSKRSQGRKRTCKETA